MRAQVNDNRQACALGDQKSKSPKLDTFSAPTRCYRPESLDIAKNIFFTDSLER